MMGMNPQTIGKTMPHGFAGSYARQPDMIVAARPAGGTARIVFGTPLKYDPAGAVVPMGEGDGAEDFVGIAARELKSSLNYLDQSAGSYAPGEAVSVFQRGCINVRCQNGAPKLGGAVYVRLAADEDNPAAVPGGFEAVPGVESSVDGKSSEGGSAAAGAGSAAVSVKLANCQWAGPADANGVAELRILTIQNA